MTYIQGHNSKIRNTPSYIAAIITIVVVIMVLIRYIFPSSFSGLVTAIARPFWRTEFSISLGQLQSAESLLKSNQQLQSELDALRSKSQVISAVLLEDQELKALMGRASSTDFVLAAVLKRPPFAPYDELIIDIGQNFGLAEGDIVYASQNIPIGKVTAVLKDTSRVTLFSSSDEKTDVLIGPINLPATAIGRGGGQYTADLPRTMTVKNGDLVTVSGIDSKLIGIVGTTISDPSNPFQQVLFSAPINIFDLKWVLINNNK